MSQFAGFCTRCGGEIEKDEAVCGCCGAETVDANTIVLLKRTSARRSRRGRDEDNGDDRLFPL